MAPYCQSDIPGLSGLVDGAATRSCQPLLLLPTTPTSQPSQEFSCRQEAVRPSLLAWWGSHLPSRPPQEFFRLHNGRGIMLPSQGALKVDLAHRDLPASDSEAGAKALCRHSRPLC